MNKHFLLILVAFVFLLGCKKDDDTAPVLGEGSFTIQNGTNTQTYQTNYGYAIKLTVEEEGADFVFITLSSKAINESQIVVENLDHVSFYADGFTDENGVLQTAEDTQTLGIFFIDYSVDLVGNYTASEEYVFQGESTLRRVGDEFELTYSFVDEFADISISGSYTGELQSVIQ